jgi:hypothetical protein
MRSDLSLKEPSKGAYAEKFSRKDVWEMPVYVKKAELIVLHQTS